jgi:hypothetical protein
MEPREGLHVHIERMMRGLDGCVVESAKITVGSRHYAGLYHAVKSGRLEGRLIQGLLNTTILVWGFEVQSGFGFGPDDFRIMVRTAPTA